LWERAVGGYDGDTDTDTDTDSDSDSDSDNAVVNLAEP